MNYVNFTPWVGKDYQNGFGETKLKLLVLGESHYCNALGKGICTDCCLQNCLNQGYSKADYVEQTITYIDELVHAYTGELYQQTGLCFERAVVGRELSDFEREDFWNHVVFYNYIQKDLPKRENERTPITENDLIGAEDAFREVLETYMPDRVVALGARLFDGLLPNWKGGVGSKLKLSDGNETDIWTYQVNGKSIPVMRIHHPSTPSGKAWEYWHKFYEVFLK